MFFLFIGRGGRHGVEIVRGWSSEYSKAALKFGDDAQSGVKTLGKWR
jgi:hypothetical protein